MKIVLVAESGFLRTTAHVNLRAFGHEVTVAEPTCLLDVLTVLREVLPHLAVLDDDLPRCSCETSVRIIREDPVLGRTPILVLREGHGDQAGAARMERWGQLVLLTKPLTVDGLRRAVDALFPTFKIVS